MGNDHKGNALRQNLANAESMGDEARVKRLKAALRAHENPAPKAPRKPRQRKSEPEPTTEETSHDDDAVSA